MDDDRREIRCPQCRLREPANWCWEHAITCPLSKPIRYGEDHLTLLRTVIWLLAEHIHEQRTNDIVRGGGRLLQ